MMLHQARRAQKAESPEMSDHRLSDHAVLQTGPATACPATQIFRPEKTDNFSHPPHGVTEV
jgi:hypothetical protein